MAPANLWAANQKAIDRISTRYQCVAWGLGVPVRIQGAIVYAKSIERFNRNQNLGERFIHYSDNILVDASDCDASGIQIGEEITLMNWGNAIVTNVTKNNGFTCRLFLEGDYKLTKKKVRWITQENYVQVKLIEYPDYSNMTNAPIESYMYGESAMKSIVKGECIQLMRMHYYICETPYNGMPGQEQEMVLIQIPNGKM